MIWIPFDHQFFFLNSVSCSNINRKKRVELQKINKKIQPLRSDYESTSRAVGFKFFLIIISKGYFFRFGLVFFFALK